MSGTIKIGGKNIPFELSASVSNMKELAINQ